MIVANAMIHSRTLDTTLTVERITHPSKPKVELPGGGGESAIAATAENVEFVSEEAIVRDLISWFLLCDVPWQRSLACHAHMQDLIRVVQPAQRLTISRRRNECWICG